MYTDPIADLLTRIRNASRAGHSSCSVPYSKIKEEVLKILAEKKFIVKYAKVEEKFTELEVTLQDTKDLTLRRLSTPGQRIYVKKDELKPIRSGLGLRIISTSKGLMSTEDAKKQNLGGELICEVY
jgi:small subunit ribosomal protein S8